MDGGPCNSTCVSSCVSFLTPLGLSAGLCHSDYGQSNRPAIMKYSLIIYGAPHVSQAPASALAFARAALEAGHELRRVFFYADGTLTANALTIPPEDESDVMQDWATLAQAHDIELAVCIAAALKRGLLNAEEASRHEKSGGNAHPAFVITGLGQLVDSLIDADRVISFHA